MKVAFDTSVLVPALVGTHAFHARAICWVQAANESKIDATLSWHALAETWAVLTRLPGLPPVPGPVAERLVSRLAEKIHPVAMTAKIYRAAIRRCADRGLRSGSVFDALHLAAAEQVEADVLLTFNPDDFTRLVSGGRPQIVVPPDPPSLRVPR